LIKLNDVEILFKSIQSIIYKDLIDFVVLKDSYISVIFSPERLRLFILTKLLNEFLILVKFKHFDIFKEPIFFIFKKELFISVKPHF
jgi:hypothetical protein